MLYEKKSQKKTKQNKKVHKIVKEIKSQVNKVRFESTPRYPIHQNTICSFRI